MATYTKSVATATDDAIQYASNSNVVTFNHVNAIDATFNYCGLRFTNATIPPGSTITAANTVITVTFLTVAQAAQLPEIPEDAPQAILEIEAADA